VGRSNLSGEELSSFEQNLKNIYERVFNLNRDLMEKTPNLPEKTVDQIQSLISLFETL
jgi:hypothetical protein